MTSNVTNQVCQVADSLDVHNERSRAILLFGYSNCEFELVNLLGLTIWLARIVRCAQFAEFAQIDLGVPAGLG